jgi:lysophospholipase L1-like esterase
MPVKSSPSAGGSVGHHRARSRDDRTGGMKHSAVTVVLTFACLFIFGVASASARGTDTTPPGKSATPQAMDPFNGRISVAVGADAHFSEGAFPDSSTGAPAPGSYTTLYGWPGTGTSFSTVRVDGNDAAYGSAAGVLVQPPIDTNPSTNVSTWTFGGVSVTQNLSIVTNPDTGLLDTAQISYTATNTDPGPHDVGLRVMLDTDVNSNDGAPFRIPGVGSVTSEQDLIGSAIPDAFQVYASLADSQHIAAARLRGAGTTTPDRLVIARWPSIVGTLYDYTPSGQDITGDSAYAAYWNPITLAPGQSRTIVTDYGLSDVTVDLTPPLAVGLSGPATLGVSGNAYTPNPFTVTATVSDAGTAVATAAVLTLSLPPGLHTSSPNPVSVGDLAPGGQEQQVSWQVTADAAASPVTLSYSVTAAASNAASKIVTRDISLPQLSAPVGSGDGTLSILVTGDSYSAGNGAGGYYGASGCRRSAYNYARQYQRLVQAAPYRQPAFVENSACSGAVTNDFFHSKDGRPAEQDSVNAGYDIIMLTMGGNDAHFSDIAHYCLIARTRDGANCGPNLTRAEGLLAAGGTIEQQLVKVLRAIQARKRGDARVVLLGYPYLEGDPNYRLRSGHFGNTFIQVGQRVRHLTDLGNAMDRRVVAKLNSETSSQNYIFEPTSSLFEGPPNHELFAMKNNPARWFIQPFVDAALVPDANLFYHPNPTGWLQEARLLLSDSNVPKHDFP